MILRLGNAPPIQLRPYQQSVVRDTYAHIRAGKKRIVIVAPTGAGKTIIAARIVADAVSRGLRIIFAVHRDVLIDQSYAKLTQAGVDCGFIKAGYQENRDAPCQIASIQTLTRRDWWRDHPADLIMLDECHILGFSGIARQMMDTVFPHAYYLGLTATPWRLSKTECLGDVFDELVCAPMPKELIEMGFLAKPVYYSYDLDFDQGSLTQVKSVGGDYDEAELALICDRPELIQHAIEQWQRLADGRPTIAFTVNVSHAEHLATALDSIGVPAAVVSGQTPPRQRQQIYRQLADGTIKVLSSCMCLTEGFDVPEVSALLLLRPTKSRALYTQQVGRGLRILDGKRDCIIIDQARNVPEHGFIEEIKIEGINKPQTSDSRVASKKRCPSEDGGCDAFLFGFQMICPHCKYRFPGRPILLATSELERHLPLEDRERFASYRKQLKDAYHKGYAPTWADCSFKEKHNYWPPYDWALHAVFGVTPAPEHHRLYEDYLRAISQRINKNAAWVSSRMKLEFGAET